jgi:nitrogen fixation protein NifU and related proteins
MSLLEQMYKEILLEHQKRPRNTGQLENKTHGEKGHNPSCGDELTLELRLENNIIAEVRFVGRGCTISQASASLMTVAIAGKTISQALEIANAFGAMLRTGQTNLSLGDLNALVGVAKLHTRVKCATLAWQTLELAFQPTPS